MAIEKENKLDFDEEQDDEIMWIFDNSDENDSDKDNTISANDVLADIAWWWEKEWWEVDEESWWWEDDDWMQFTISSANQAFWKAFEKEKENKVDLFWIEKKYWIWNESFWEKIKKIFYLNKNLFSQLSYITILTLFLIIFWLIFFFSVVKNFMLLFINFAFLYFYTNYWLLLAKLSVIFLAWLFVTFFYYLITFKRKKELNFVVIYLFLFLFFVLALNLLWLVSTNFTVNLIV